MFDPEEKGKIISLLSAVPDDIRQKFQTPERIVAFLFMGGQRMEFIRVLTETPPLDDAVVVLIEFSFFDDPTVRKEGLIFSRDVNRWKSVVPMELVERMTKTLNSGSSK